MDTMDTTDIYSKLIEYQVILTEKFKFEERKEELPKVLHNKSEILNRLKKSYLARYSQFKQIENTIIANQRFIGELSLRQKSLEEKTKIVKGAREYDAIAKEIESNKLSEEKYGFKLLQEQRVLEDLKNNIERDEMSIKQQEEEIAKEQDRINSELSKIDQELAVLLEKERELVGNIDGNLKFKFERIVKNKDGVGIVTISKGHCNGCYMILPNEFINLVRKNDTVQYCPNCSRILYHDESPDSLFVIDYDEGAESDSAYFGDE